MSSAISYNEYITYLISSDAGTNTLSFYCVIIEHALDRPSVGGDAIYMSETASNALLSLMEAAPMYFAALYKSRGHWFLSFLRSTTTTVRESVSSMISLVMAENEDEIVLSFIDILISGIKEGLGIGLDAVHGYLLALGNIVAVCHYRSSISTASLTSSSSELISSAFSVMMEHLDHRVHVIKGAACDAIGVIGLNGSLSIPSQDKDILVTKLSTLAGSSNKDNKVVEKAVICIGNVVYGEGDVLVGKRLLDGIFALCDNTNEEIQLAVSQALAKAASNALYTEHVYNKIMNEFFISPKPVVRRATAIWLLALVKFNYNDAYVQDHFPSIHVAFTSMLNDKNDLVQECAGKGLALLYEYSKHDSMKKDLLHSLVNTLTTGLRSASALQTGASTTTEIFNEGDNTASNTTAPVSEASSNAPSSYSELCSMVNEMGNPDLIYKFLSLSSHHSLWNSRRGATFGLGELLKGSAKEALEPYMKVSIYILYKIYRH